MKRYGSIDIDKNLKVRGVVVDDLTTQGGFYSQQFGEVIYRSTLAAGSNITITQSGNTTTIASTASGEASGGFYGITVKHSNNSDSFKGINLVAFDVTDFYVTQNSPNTDEVVVSLRDRDDLTSVTVRESDGSPSFATDTIVFDSTDFYLSATSGGKPTVSLRDRTALNGATYVHTQTSSSREWTVAHNFSSKNLIAQAFSLDDKIIEPDEVDTSDPNTAYFYFIPAVTGKAIVTTGSGTTVSIGSNEDIISFHIHSPSVDNYFLESFVQKAFEVIDSQLITKSGSCTVGFYILGDGQRYPGVSIRGLDPISASTTKITSNATGNTTVSSSDSLLLSVPTNSSSTHLRGRLRIRLNP